MMGKFNFPILIILGITFLMLFYSIYQNPASAQSTKIVIEPDAKLLEDYDIMIGAPRFVTVTIEGELQDKGYLKLITQGPFGQSKTPRTYEEQVQVTKGHPVYVFELDYPFLSNETYQITAINGDYSTTLEWIPLPKEIEATKELAVTETKINLITLTETKISNHWLTTIQYCPGITGVTEPIVIIDSDLERAQHTWKKKISPGSCAQDFFEVTAEDPNTISVGIGSTLVNSSTPDFSKFQEEITQLKQRISELEEQLKKKDAIIMEQLKVISDLVNMIKNALYTQLSSLFSF